MSGGKSSQIAVNVATRGAAAGDEQSAVVAEEAVVEIAGDGRGNDTDDVGTADREHSGTGDALTGEASAVDGG